MTTKPISFTLAETIAALRYVRAAREGIHIDTTRLMDKLSAQGNGATHEAIRLLDEEVALFDGVIRKLWAALL